MNVTDWNAIAYAYSDLADPHERAVLALIRVNLAKRHAKGLCDPVGGGGGCAYLCGGALSVLDVR